MKVTNEQIKIIHALIPEVIKNDKEQKANLVHQFTKDWSKTSTKDLTYIQANELIIRFGGSPLTYNHWGIFDYKKGSHRMILSLLNQMGWQTFCAKRRGMIADMQRFSEWLKSNKSPVQKPLNKMSSKEISKIITALENMAK